jgi:predicted DNA-binding transcriptional regulator AlpA
MDCPTNITVDSKKNLVFETMPLTMSRRTDKLPLSLPPRGLSRHEAAAYIGVSPSLFDEMVKDGRMPAPKHVNSRVIWDRYRLDVAFEALPDTVQQNPWDNSAI